MSRFSAVLLAVAFAAPAAACQQVQLGLGWLESPRFSRGELSGAGGGDSFGVLRIDACRTRGEGDGDARHASLVAHGLGLPTRRVFATLGLQGRYRIDVELGRIAGQRTTAVSPVARNGERFELPPGWQGAASTAGMGLLLPSLGSVDLDRERNVRAIGLKAILPSGWDVETRVREDRITGLRPFAGVIGSTGGNARAILLPAPIDGNTRRLDAAMFRAWPQQQLRLAYHLSLYNAGSDRVVWRNPFAGVAGWAAGAGFPGGIGQAALAPDNQFHQVSLGYARQINGGPRFSLDLARGRATQNAPLLPYTANAVLAATTSALPRATLDGRIESTLLRIRLGDRTPGGWQWNLGYRWDERDNRTPQTQWNYVAGDAQAQSATPAGNRIRTNLAYAFREHRVDADLAARLGGGTVLALGAAHSDVERRFGARQDSRETRLRLDLRRSRGADLQLGLRLEGAERGGSTYIGNRAFNASFAPAYVDSVPGAFANLPDLRSYPEADRRRGRLALVAQWSASPEWNLGLSHGYTRDDYHRSTLGLTDGQLRDLHVDLGHTSSSGAHVSLFAGRDWMSFDQAGRAFQGGANRLPQAGDPARNWFVAHRDRVDSAGLVVQKRFFDDRLRLGGDLAWSLARGVARFSTGSALTSAPLPPSVARLQTLELDAEWTLSARVHLRLALREERFDARDGISSELAPATLANVILLGEDSPDYRARAVMLSLVFGR